MSIIQIGRGGIEQTLAFLKQVGQVECVVLWLAKKQGGFLNIQTIYLPQQIADYDYFHIPQESMEELFAYLRQNRLMVAAQVHTHPGRAFHSPADDRWAIIRHVGGLSLVLPNFAATTSPETFIKNAAVFRLSENNQWKGIPANEIVQHYRVTL
jgi:sugar phosphate isomerase/epimerase